MVGEILTGLELVIMGLWVFVVLFIAHKVNNRSSKNKKTPYTGQQGQYDYPQFPEEKTELNISEEERKLKEWLNDVFGTNIEIDRPQPVIYEEEPSYVEEEKKLYEDFEERYIKESLEEETITEPTSVINVGVNNKNMPAFYNLNIEQVAQGVIMAEVLGKPRALNPIRHKYHRYGKNTVSA